MQKELLQLQQLSRKMSAFGPVQQSVAPPVGWIKAIRLALGMSAEQLASKLGMTRQGVHSLEKREKEGALTLNTLQETAEALDMQLVYGFVPKDGSLDALIERKAKALATQIVQRTSASMKLEDQENSPARIKQAIGERTAAIIKEMPKALWN